MIKQPLVAGIALIFFLAFTYFVVERVLFINAAERTVGTVTEVLSKDGRCGGGRRRRRYPCTKFVAVVTYVVDQKMFRLNLSAGSARGYDRPIDRASYTHQQHVKVVYSRENPAHAYEDSLWGVWAVPIILFFGQLVTFITSLVEPRKRVKEQAANRSV
jgi:hypothetical protein